MTFQTPKLGTPESLDPVTHGLLLSRARAKLCKNPMSQAPSEADPIFIRHVQTDDLHALKVLLTDLSPGTLYYRFGRFSTPTWTDEQWQALCDPDPHRCANFVAADQSACENRAIVGIARLVLDLHLAGAPRSAEFSLVVADQRQNQGIGQRLMHRLIDEASRRELTSIYGDVLPSNRAMLSFCKGLGFVPGSSPSDSRICRLTMSIG